VGTCSAGDTMCAANNSMLTCLPTGMWGTDPVPCVNQTCTSGACAGTCAPGQTACSGNAVVTCAAGGAWGTPAACSNQTCVVTTSPAVDGGASTSLASCQGMCPAGQLACNGQQPTQCGPDGQWQNLGAPCAGSTPVCNTGTCGACAPGALGCSGAQPDECKSDGTGWQSRGSMCTGVTPFCLNGACVVCTPGTEQCAQCDRSGYYCFDRQKCGPSGAWEEDACPTGLGCCMNGGLSCVVCQ
jgi:hypothetical protein